MPADTASEAVRAPLTIIVLAPADAKPTEKCVIVFDPAVHAAKFTAAAFAAVVGAVPDTVQAEPERETATLAYPV